jgi:hypothetical protein
MTGGASRCRLLVAAILLLGPLARAAPAEDYDFMPKGGKALLLELLGTPLDPAELRKLTQARHTEAEWRAIVARRGKAFTDRQLATLAAYLAVYMPLAPAGTKDAAKSGDLSSSLPPDGRELAWKQCQSCHSLFASHLTQDRDAQGWRNMFLSPFHREMKMSPQEREEFARYSALNMPMKFEDVPEELRF